MEDDHYWHETVGKRFDFEEDSQSNILMDNISAEVEYIVDEQFSQVTRITDNVSLEAINAILCSDESKKSTFVPNAFKSNIHEELKYLRRQLICNPNETVRNILMDRAYSLEHYKSLSSKKSLLIAAVTCGDGNAILVVAVFLSKTVKKTLFHRLLSEFPTAVSHYVNYLYVRRQMRDLSELLEIMGSNKEWLMKQVSVAAQNPNRLLQRLKICAKYPGKDPYDDAVVDNYVKLVEWQTVVSKITSDANIVGKSVVYSMRYFCAHNNTLQIPRGPSPSFPEDFAKFFGMCEKQSLVASAFGYAECGCWDKVDQLLISKNWAGGKRLNTTLPVHDLMKDFKILGASDEFLDDLLLLIDMNERVKIAKKLGRGNVIADTYAKKKDRQALLQYLSSLEISSQEYSYVEKILQQNIKWKN